MSYAVLPPDLAPVIQDVVTETLETMCFFTVMDRADVAWAPQEFCGRVSFAGEHSGYLHVCVSRDAVRSMAGNFLGEDENELSEEQFTSVFCEIINMLCGALLSRLWPDSLFALSTPGIEHSEPVAGASKHGFELETGVLGIWFATT